MRVISKPRLREFWQKHPDAERPLLAWWKTVESIHTDWASIQDVRKTYPAADGVKLDSGLVVTVFNIGGGKHRLVTGIVYPIRRVYIKKVMTHQEYGRGRWKNELCA